jgi:hypothetical protein
MVGVVEKVFVRSEGEIDSFLFTEDEVIFERAGVVTQIGVAIELDRINKN